MILQEARNIAINEWNKLKPHCDIIKIAGSIRREKPEVKDIEIVALPKIVEIKDLFGAVTGYQRIEQWSQEVAKLGEAVKGKPSGKYMQIKLSAYDIVLDLFMPDDFDYWRQFAIRTGSADWTARYIAGGWTNLGWCGSNAGLRLKSECKQIVSPTNGSKSWKCIVAEKEQTKPPHWNSEKELFEWLKLSWVEPKFRI